MQVCGHPYKCRYISKPKIRASVSMVKRKGFSIVQRLEAMTNVCQAPRLLWGAGGMAEG